MQEGAGHAVLSAFVEIVFDNSDNRLPVSLLSLQQADRNNCMPSGMLQHYHDICGNILISGYIKTFLAPGGPG